MHVRIASQWGRIGSGALVVAALLFCGAMPTAAAENPPAKPPQPTSLPGGATSLQESYQDWSVVCAVPNGSKRCTMSQQQQNPQSRQRVLGIELSGLSSDHADGILLLPFGLSFDLGVTLQIDDGPVGSPLHFRTCLPVGCVVPISFDAKMLATLRRSATLAIRATADGASETSFAVSLKGFGTAFDRTLSLAR